MLSFCGFEGAVTDEAAGERRIGIVPGSRDAFLGTVVSSVFAVGRGVVETA